MYADALLSLLSLALFLIVFYGPWQAVCTDLGRQVIFESRHKIFDMAADGELDFDSQEYKDIRESLELLIRYLHFATAPAVLVHMIFGVNKENSTLRMSIDRIETTETRRKVSRYVWKAQNAVIMTLLAKSLPGVFIIAAAFIASKIHINRRKYAEVVSERIQRDAEIAAY